MTESSAQETLLWKEFCFRQLVNTLTRMAAGDMRDLSGVLQSSLKLTRVQYIRRL